MAIDVSGWRVVGLATTAVGAVLVLVSFTALNWYGAQVFGARSSFGSLRGDLDALRRPDFSQVYFDWLAWLALVAAVVLAVLANRRSRSHRLRVAAAAFALLAAVSSYLALWGLFAYAENSGATGVGVFEHAAPGVYLALGGFLVIAAGALLDRSAPTPTPAPLPAPAPPDVPAEPEPSSGSQ